MRLRGVLGLLVLGVLACGESYGHEIARRLDAGGPGTIAGGTFYPALLRLEGLGLVVARWRTGRGGRVTVVDWLAALTAELRRRRADLEDALHRGGASGRQGSQMLSCSR